MTIYLLCVFFILIFGTLFSLSPLKSELRRKLLCFSIFSFLFLISALRKETVGGDLLNYLPAYQTISWLPWSESWSSVRYEPGYILLNKLLSLFFRDERILLIFTSFIIIGGFSKYIYEHSLIPWLSFFLFVTLGFYTNTFNSLRSSIAMVILVNSIKHVISKNFFRFLLYIIIAGCFHITSLIFIVIYPLSILKVTWKYFIIFIGGTAIFAHFFSFYILSFLLGNYYRHYLSSNALVSIGEGYNLALLLILITGGGIFLYKKSGQRNREADVYMHIMIVACGLQILAPYFSLLTRVALFFYVNMIIYFPMLLSFIRNKKIKILFIIGICLLTFVYLWLIVFRPTDGGTNNSQGVLPYLFLWD